MHARAARHAKLFAGERTHDHRAGFTDDAAGPTTDDAAGPTTDDAARISIGAVGSGRVAPDATDRAPGR